MTSQPPPGQPCRWEALAGQRKREATFCPSRVCSASGPVKATPQAPSTPGASPAHGSRAPGCTFWGLRASHLLPSGGGRGFGGSRGSLFPSLPRCSLFCFSSPRGFSNFAWLIVSGKPQLLFPNSPAFQQFCNPCSILNSCSVHPTAH